MAGMWGEYGSPVVPECPSQKTGSQYTCATQPASSRHRPAVGRVTGRGHGLRSGRLEAGVVILSTLLTA